MQATDVGDTQLVAAAAVDITVIHRDSGGGLVVVGDAKIRTTTVVSASAIDFDDVMVSVIVTPLLSSDGSGSGSSNSGNECDCDDDARPSTPTEPDHWNVHYERVYMFVFVDDFLLQWSNRLNRLTTAYVLLRDDDDGGESEDLSVISVVGWLLGDPK